MTLILRKCNYDGSSRNGFKYGQVGDRVTCPDWNPLPYCGNGLHGLKEGNGNWTLLDGIDWLIIDADDQIVDIDESKCKFNTGIILFRGTSEELSKSEFPNKLNLNSNAAYYWARDIGNHDIMISKIKNSYYAYFWAKDIGNHDVMISKINDSYWAYQWALNIGNHDVMMHKITDSYYAYCWASGIGNHDVMINKINNSFDAYCWAKNIGNHDIMKTKITDDSLKERWNRDFPYNQITIESFQYNQRLYFKNIFEKIGNDN